MLLRNRLWMDVLCGVILGDLGPGVPEHFYHKEDLTNEDDLDSHG